CNVNTVNCENIVNLDYYTLELIGDCAWSIRPDQKDSWDSYLADVGVPLDGIAYNNTYYAVHAHTYYYDNVETEETFDVKWTGWPILLDSWPENPGQKIRDSAKDINNLLPKLYGLALKSDPPSPETLDQALAIVTNMISTANSTTANVFDYEQRLAQDKAIEEEKKKEAFIQMFTLVAGFALDALMGPVMEAATEAITAVVEIAVNAYRSYKAVRTAEEPADVGEVFSETAETTEEGVTGAIDVAKSSKFSEKMPNFMKSTATKMEKSWSKLKSAMECSVKTLVDQAIQIGWTEASH
ncbi:hypothetical protein HDU76_008085, partial [Blyttiomyces sp. JEL0837]